mmetsp:Transcript_71953/g.127160  ORF Transcript_71953/g.127160 Transcript_71953/m.127160 type:complete len:809 (+) Transcript_71953:30-2456(+)
MGDASDNGFWEGDGNACCYSVPRLLALRPAVTSRARELEGLKVHDVSPEEIERRRKEAERKNRRGPIGPITECVPADAEVLLSKRSELRRIEQVTGAQIKERAGLRGYTVMVTGTTAIVQQALPMVEQALMVEEESLQQPVATEPPPAEPLPGKERNWAALEQWQIRPPPPPPPPRPVKVDEGVASTVPVRASSELPPPSDADDGFWDEVPTSPPPSFEPEPREAQFQAGGSSASRSWPDSGTGEILTSAPSRSRWSRNQSRLAEEPHGLPAEGMEHTGWGPAGVHTGLDNPAGSDSSAVDPSIDTPATNSARLEEPDSSPPALVEPSAEKSSASRHPLPPCPTKSPPVPFGKAFEEQRKALEEQRAEEDLQPCASPVLEDFCKDDQELPLASCEGLVEDDLQEDATSPMAEETGTEAAKPKKPKKKKKKTEKSEEVQIASSPPSKLQALASLFSKTKFSGLGQESEEEQEEEEVPPAPKASAKKAQAKKEPPKASLKEPPPFKQLPVSKEPAQEMSKEPQPPGPPPKSPLTKEPPAKHPPVKVPSKHPLEAPPPKQPPPPVPKDHAASKQPPAHPPVKEKPASKQPPPASKKPAPAAKQPSAWKQAAVPPYPTENLEEDTSWEAIFAVSKVPLKEPPAPVKQPPAKQPALMAKVPPAKPAAKVIPQKPVEVTKKAPALNPLPQRPAKAATAYGGSGNAQSMAALKWMDRPVEKVQSYYEEEDDPDLQRYLWDRRSQQPRNNEVRAAPKQAMVSVATAVSKAAPAPHKQRAMLTQVMDMGFDEFTAKRALSSTGWGGVEEALSVLLGN